MYSPLDGCVYFAACRWRRGVPKTSARKSLAATSMPTPQNRTRVGGSWRVPVPRPASRRDHVARRCSAAPAGLLLGSALGRARKKTRLRAHVRTRALVLQGCNRAHHHVFRPLMYFRGSVGSSRISSVNRDDRARRGYDITRDSPTASPRGASWDHRVEETTTARTRGAGEI